MSVEDELDRILRHLTERLPDGMREKHTYIELADFIRHLKICSLMVELRRRG